MIKFEFEFPINRLATEMLEHGSIQRDLGNLLAEEASRQMEEKIGGDESLRFFVDMKVDYIARKKGVSHTRAYMPVNFKIENHYFLTTELVSEQKLPYIYAETEKRLFVIKIKNIFFQEKITKTLVEVYNELKNQQPSVTIIIQ